MLLLLLLLLSIIAIVPSSSSSMIGRSRQGQGGPPANHEGIIRQGTRQDTTFGTFALTNCAYKFRTMIATAGWCDGGSSFVAQVLNVRLHHRLVRCAWWFFLACCWFAVLVLIIVVVVAIIKRLFFYGDVCKGLLEICVVVSLLVQWR